MSSDYKVKQAVRERNKPNLYLLREAQKMYRAEYGKSIKKNEMIRDKINKYKRRIAQMMTVAR